MSSQFDRICQQILADPANREMQDKGYAPLYSADGGAKIVIIGQAPGLRAQESMKPWDDASGDTLRGWLGVTKEQFYDPNIIALLPMDFYYPGKGKSGDLPPRKDFAPKWHPQLLKLMSETKLTILIGAYAQKHYLGKSAERNLTETVRNFQNYLPKYFPLVHSSPLNFRWQAKNPWFKTDVLPVLKKEVEKALKD